uniref:YciI family protein n=1 Tax=Pararhizobium sp. IMCC3301 TaxID=3067904 RepID=UPI0027416E85|nr:YciI family protein [Pararhizobium sp. IMCC3301]
MEYAILIYGAEGTFDRLPPEKQQEAMQSHYELQAALQERGAYGTAKLMPTTSAVTLRPVAEFGQKPTLMDGPFAETKERFLAFMSRSSTRWKKPYHLLKKSPRPMSALKSVRWHGLAACLERSSDTACLAAGQICRYPAPGPSRADPPVPQY